MLSAIAIVPSAPVMVPELAGAAAAETAELRAAALAVAAALPQRWVAVGTAAVETRCGPDAVGTFAGYGVDVPVRLSGTAHAAAAALPLCALIAGWLRGLASPEAVAELRAVAAATPGHEALVAGRELRAELDGNDDAVGVLIVADGATTLTASAPGGHDPDSVPVQAALDDALAAGRVADLIDLPDGIVGRAAYQVLAGLAEPAPRTVEERYRGAPYGVGYFVGLWTP